MNDQWLSQLKVIQADFSNKQKKLVEKIKPCVGERVAVALVSMQGVKGTSQEEIKVVANVISMFQSLKIKKMVNSPRALVIQGTYLKGCLVEVTPQYAVDKYSIDLVIMLFLSKETLHIASIGIEYDGHIAHYVESNIKKSYRRDSEILGTGIPLLKISPEQKNDISAIQKNIGKYFKHQIKVVKNVQKNTAKQCTKNNFHLDKICPVCEGLGSIANNFCPECKSVGRIDNREIDLLQYLSFDCPDCTGIILSSCLVCLGKGWIDRDKAIQWQRRHENEDT